MGFRRSCRAANAVTTRAPAKQHDYVAGGGSLAPHVIGRRGTYHGANLHALGDIARMIELGDLACGQADLVAIGRIALGGRGYELALGKLAWECLGDRRQRITCARDAHSLVDIAATRKGVANGPADAGSRATKGLNFGRMVVGLIFKEEKPVLVRAVDIYLHVDCAGVDLLGLIEVFEDPACLQAFRANCCHVHERDRLFVTIKLMAYVEVACEGLLHDGVVYLHVMELRAECRVAAMI